MREKYVYPDEIKNGCTEGEETEFQESFENIDEAKNALKNHSSNSNDNYKEFEKVLVCEYFIEEEIFDEDGDFESSKIIEYADGLE